MEERINEIVSSEAIEQLRSLGKMLEESDVKMQTYVRTMSDFRKSLDNAQGARDIGVAVQNLTSSIVGFIAETRNCVKMQSKFTAVSESLKKSIDEVSSSTAVATSVLSENRKELSDLIVLREKEKSSLKDVGDKIQEYKSGMASTGDAYEVVKNRTDELRVRCQELSSTIEGIKNGTVMANESDKDREKTLETLNAKYEESKSKLEELNGVLSSGSAVEASKGLDILIEKEKEHKSALTELDAQIKNNQALDLQGVELQQQVKSTLTQMKDKYAELTEEEKKNEEVGGVLRQGIDDLTGKLKVMEQGNESVSKGLEQIRTGSESVVDAARSTDSAYQGMSDKISTVSADLQVGTQAQKEYSSAVLEVSAKEAEYNAAMDGAMNVVATHRLSLEELIRLREREKMVLVDLKSKIKEYESGIVKSTAAQDAHSQAVNTLKATLAELQNRIGGVKDGTYSANASDEQRTEILKSLNQQYEETKQKLNELRSANVSESTNEMSEGLEALKEKEMAHQQSLADINRQIKENQTLERDDLGLKQQLQAQLNIMRSTYDSLSEAELKNEEVGGALRAGIQATKQQLSEIKKEEEGAAQVAFRTRLRQLRNEIMGATESLGAYKMQIEEQKAITEIAAQTKGKESAEYINAKQKLDDLTSSYDTTKEAMMRNREELTNLMRIQKMTTAEMNALSDPSSGIKAVTMGINTMASGYRLASSTMALFGGDNEKIKQSLMKVMLVQQAMNALQTIGNNLSKKSIMMSKLRLTWEKISLEYKRVKAVEMEKENAAEAINTTVTNQNTRAQVANAGAEAAGAAGAGALAAGEGVATAASFTLTAALKAVGAAIKSIPVIGWILAAVGALTTLTVLVAKNISQEKQLSTEGYKRLEIYKSEREAKVSSLESSVKEVHAVESAVKAINEMAKAKGESKVATEAEAIQYEGINKTVFKHNMLVQDGVKLKEYGLSNEKLINSEVSRQNGIYSASRSELASINKENAEYKRNVKIVADNLGLSEEWLSQNVTRVNELATAWIKVRRAQATSDAYNNEASSRQVEFEKTLLKMESANYKEREKILKESGLFSASAIATITKAAHNSGFSSKEYKSAVDAARKENMSVVESIYELGEAATNSVEGDMKKIAEAQKKGSNKAVKNANTMADKMQSAHDKITDSYSSMRAQIESYHDSEGEGDDTYRTKLSKIEARYAKEKSILDNALKSKVISQTEYEQDIDTLENLYGKKGIERAKVEAEEKKRVAKSILDANKEAVKVLDELDKKRIENSNLNSDELQSRMLENENQRYAREKNMRIASFNEELKDVQLFSEEYNAIVDKYAAMMENDAYSHEQNMDKIVKDGWAGRKKELTDYFKAVSNQNVIDGKTDSITALNLDVEKAKTEQSLFNQQIDEAVEKYGNLDAALQHLGMTKDEYGNAMLENEAKVVAAENKLIDEQISMYTELASAIGSAIVTIGNALAEGVEDEVQQVKIQQALATGQVLLEQGIALAGAIRSAVNGSSTWYEAAAKIAVAVATVTAQFINAKNAIAQAKQSVSEAESYAEGTEYHKGGPAIVGEGGYPELVSTKSGNFLVDTPTYIEDLPVGSKVIPIRKDIGMGAQVDLTALEDGVRKLNDKSVVRIDVGENVYKHIVKGSNRARVLNKQFSH